MEKRCRDCGAYYNTKDREVKLMLNHKDIETIEDALFTSSKITKQDERRIQKFWEQLCDEEEKWETNEILQDKELMDQIRESEENHKKGRKFRKIRLEQFEQRTNKGKRFTRADLGF
ncbi:MAG: hypothetical protein AABX29_07510 [Nanoarchaeota archaeon]